jgi:hypothetical protein
MDSGGKSRVLQLDQAARPTKGFDFDESKVKQIFDLLLREKQLKLPKGHKFPTAQELQGRPYCK